MEIWFYKPELQLGDYVYSDGSYSSILNIAKTVVGICFYINNERNLRLCVAPKSIEMYCWGLYSPDWPDGIQLYDRPNYNVFQGILKTNQSDYQKEIGVTESDITYKQVQSGELIPYGLLNTLRIITHRNNILTDSNINLQIPAARNGMTEYEVLSEALQSIVKEHSDETKYTQFYYPLASFCHAYSPQTKDGEILAETFKPGNWWFPSAGELRALYECFTAGSGANGSGTAFDTATRDGVWTLRSTSYTTSTLYTFSNPLTINLSNGTWTAGHGANLLSTLFSTLPITRF